MWRVFFFSFSQRHSHFPKRIDGDGVSWRRAIFIRLSNAAIGEQVSSISLIVQNMGFDSLAPSKQDLQLRQPRQMSRRCTRTDIIIDGGNNEKRSMISNSLFGCQYWSNKVNMTTTRTTTTNTTQRRRSSCGRKQVCPPSTIQDARPRRVTGADIYFLPPVTHNDSKKSESWKRNKKVSHRPNVRERVHVGILRELVNLI